jgi:hypothetical protein
MMQVDGEEGGPDRGRGRLVGVGDRQGDFLWPLQILLDLSLRGRPAKPLDQPIVARTGRTELRRALVFSTGDRGNPILGRPSLPTRFGGVVNNRLALGFGAVTCRAVR